MRPAIFRIVVFLAAACLPNWLQGQKMQLPYRHFTVHDGLPQMQVTCLFQDSRGYIWIGTKAGVSKFNGERFENFRPDQGRTSDQVSQIKEDWQGNIWVSTNGGCARYDGAHWRTVLSKNKLTSLEILDTLVLGWSAEKKTLWRLTPDTAIVLQQFDVLPAFFDGEARLHLSMTRNPSTSLMLGLDKDLRPVSLDSFDNKKDLTIPLENFSQGFLNAAWDKKTRWCRIFQAGGQGSADAVRFPAGMRSPAFLEMLRLKNGDTYFSTGFDFCIRRKNDSMVQRLDLPVVNITCLLEDQEGAIWLGGEDGLYQYFPAGFRFISTRDIPLPWSMVEVDRGDFYVGTYGHGLKLLRHGKVEDIKIPTSIVPPGNDPLHFYFGAVKDHEGSLYFSNELGLIRYKNGRFDNLTLDAPQEKKTVLLTRFDPVRRKVLAGVKGGVYVFDPIREKLDSIVFDSSKSYVLAMAQDRAGNYWFSRTWSGIGRYDPETKAIRFFNFVKQEIPFSGAWCIQYDSTGGGLWFGAPDGLYYFDERTEHFSKVAPLALYGPVFNLQIAGNLLLVGDLAGVFVLNLPAFHGSGSAQVKAYNHLNGFTGIEPGQNSALLDSEGNYWVLCSNQIASIHRDDISLAGYPARVRIFQVNDERVPFQSEREIELKYGINDVSVRFEAIGFQRPLRTQYRWKLTGDESGEWSGWSEDFFAFLPKLPGGRYLFEVQSRHPGSGDEAASVSDSVRFQVSLPIYREPDFFKTAFLLVIGSIVAAVVLGFFYRKLKRKEREAKQVAQERERLANLHQMRAVQAHLNPHFLFNLLDAIHHHVKKGDTADAARQILQLSNLMKGVLDNNLELDGAKLADGEYDVSLDREIELLRCYVELRQALHPGSFTFSIEKDESLHTSNVYVPPMMIQPFVENAIRHGLLPVGAQPGHLSLRFFREGEAVVCEVRDNGKGMGEQPPPPPIGHKKDRLHGMEMVQNRASLLRAFGVEVGIEFSENPGGGTVVKVRFGKK